MTRTVADLHRRTFSVEWLEARQLLAVDTVTTNLDDGSAGTLRSVIAAAAPGDTIQFQSGITQIDLTQGQIELNKNLTVQGPGANSLTIDQTSSGGARLFQIDATDGSNNPVQVSISGLTLTGGNVGQANGGAIFNSGNLSLNAVSISGNSGNDGAGLFNAAGGTATVTASTFSGNTASGNGGGILNDVGGALTATDDTLANNSASLGGGIYNAGTATFLYDTLSGNSATTQASGIYNAAAATANVANTIIAGNTASGGDPDVAGDYAVTDSDLIGIVGDATGFATSGALQSTVLGTDSASAIGLGPLANNGGPTQTMAVLANGPAFENGDTQPPSPFVTPATDQRGQPRVSHNWTDIGAYQTAYTPMYRMTPHSVAQTGLPAVSDGAIAWGDVNNDGKLDLIITGKDAGGTPITQLWMNQGNDTFQQASLPASVVGLYSGSVAWGDYDNDGYIDLALTGFDAAGAPHTYLLHNEGQSNPGVFDDVTQIAMPGVPGVGYSSVTWGMVNEDGLRDLLISGQQADGTPTTQLWMNDGKGGYYNGTRFAFPSGITAVAHGSASWADLDINGYFGFVLTGNDASGAPVTEVWRNNTDGTFSQDATAASRLPALGHSAAAFSYYALTGNQLALLLSGQDAAGNWVTRLYNENGWTDITDSEAPGLSALEIADPTIAWGDFSNIKFDDFVISGKDAANNDAPITRLWFNDPIADAFTDATAAAFGTNNVNVASAAIAVGDAEGDRGIAAKADLLITGEGAGGPVMQLWANNGTSLTQFGLGVVFLDGDVLPPSLLQRPTSDPSEVDLSVDYTDVAYVAPNGGLAAFPSFTLSPSITGSTTWTIEALSDGTPTVPNNNLVLRVADAPPTGVVIPNLPFVTEWGGSLFIPLHLPGGTMSIGFSLNMGVQGGTGDTDPPQIPITVPLNTVDVGELRRTASGVSGDVSAGPTLQWLDVNGDGKLDLFVGNGPNVLWQNNGNGTFTNVTAQAFPDGLPQPLGLAGGSTSAYAWGDYDNDGLPDLLISGYDAAHNPITELWHNNGAGKAFTNVTAQLFPGQGRGLAQIISGSAAWGDFNNDGRLDLLISGSGFQGAGFFQSEVDLPDQTTAITQLWEQTPEGTFTDVTASAFTPPTIANPWTKGLNAEFLPNSFFGPSGDLAHYQAATQGTNSLPASARETLDSNKAQYYLSSDVTGAMGVPGLDYGAVSWVDYNNDSQLDLLISGVGSVWDNNPFSTASGGDPHGQSLVSQGFTELWRNNGDGTFTNVTNTALPGASSEGSQFTSWGDYDNNGHADLYLSGGLFSSNGQLWHNNGDGTFTQTASPAAGNGAWGDFFGNGRLDLLVANGGNGSVMYKNNGDGTFSGQAPDYFPNDPTGVPGDNYDWSAALGDARGNGLVNIALTSSEDNSVIVASAPTNQAPDFPPTAPNGLLAQVHGTSVAFSWNAPADSRSTPASGLVYKLRVGTTPGGQDVVSPVYVNADSNVLRTLNYTLQGLTVGQRYYWSVEAIDDSYHTSPFAAEQSFVVAAHPVQIVGEPADETGAGGSQVAFTASAVGAPNPAVQWYISTDGGNTFNPVSDNGEFSGATQTTPAIVTSNGVSEGTSSAMLTISNVPFNLNNAEFKAVFSNDGFATSVATNAAKLMVTAMTPTVTITGAGGLSNGNAHGVSGLTVTGFGGVTLVNTTSDSSLTYTYYAGSFTTAAQLAGQTPLAGAPSAAGTYTVVAHWSVSQWNGANKQDYTDADSAPTVFAIRTGSLTVTSAADSDPFFLYNTLREAIAFASTQSGTPTVAFAAGMFAAEIGLNSPLVINHNMTIAGSPGGAQTIHGPAQGSLFDVTSGTVVLRRLVLTGGSAVNGGAIFNQGNLTLDSDVLTDNSATTGGAVYNAAGATVMLVNAMLINNSAATAGALFNDGAATLTNVTVTGNDATQNAGGLDSDAGTLNLMNTIVAGNNAAGSPSDISGSVAGTYNLVGTGGAGSLATDAASHNQIDVANPLLGPLGYYGGAIETIPLLPGSPAINAGTTGTGVPSTDARAITGFTRAGAPDIGAFESRGFTLSGVAGDEQQVFVNSPSAPLKGALAPKFASEPIAGGVISFAVDPNSNGAGAVLAANSIVLDSSGTFSMTATANGIAGSYTVTASANGVTPVVYHLTNVASAPLTAGDLIPPAATEGQTFGPVTVFHFTDGNPNATVSDYTATVNTGDATLTSTANPSNVMIVADAGGGFDVQLAYAYADELNGATFSVTVNGVGGASTSASRTITVADAPPAVSADKTSVSAVENSLASNTGTWSDLDDAVTLSASYGTVTKNNNGTWSWAGTVPDEASSITVTITATNADNSVSTTSFIVSGTDAPPAVSADKASVSAIENSLASNTGTWSDFDDAVTLTASYGTVTKNIDGTWSWSGAAPDEASSITVTITATNADLSASTTSFTVSGTDAPPTISADKASVSTAENSTASNTGTWSDLDDAVTLTASYGTVTKINNGTWSWSGAAPDEASSFTVTITATNADHSVSTTSFVVSGTDAPPTVSADKASVNGVENSLASNTGTWSDLDDAVTLTASYGTVTQNNNGTWSWAGAAPDEATSITVTITATNSDHSVSTTSFTVNGIDATPTVSADKASISAVENSSASNSGTWSDFDDAVMLAASYGTVTQSNNGTWTWTGAVPDEANSITITITATNGDHSVSTTSFTVNGTDAPLTGSSVATAAGIAAVQPAVLANAIFGDGNTAAPATDFTVTAANWGDGSTSIAGLSISGSGGTYAVNGSHLYAHQGKYPFSITVTDVGGQTAVIHGTATVAPLPVELLLLDSRGKGSLDLSGNADVELTSGPASVVVDSKNSAAVTVSGNAKLSAYELDVVGSPGVSVRGKPSLPGSVLSGVSAMSDPLSGLPAPPRPDGRPLGEIHARGHFKITLSPGVYLGGISVSDDATIVLKPGVYYVRGGIHVSGHGALIGDGVLIYSGSADDDDGISVTGQGRLQLSAPTSGPYQGIAIFQDPRSQAPINVDGEGSLEVTGIIYAASATLNIDGNGQASISNATPNGPAGAILADLKIDGDGRLSIDPGSVTAASGALGQTKAQPTNADSPHAFYVEAVYEDVLGRTADEAGLAYWTQLLDAGAPPAAVSAAIAHSDEYYADFVIAPAYLNLLGRDVDAESLKAWLPGIHQGMPDQQLVATLAASDEFYKNAGGTNTDWIDAVYTLLLGRSAEPTAEVYWNSLLNAGVSRFVVAEGIANSNENETQLINDAYFQYLGRAADPAGLAYWLGQFAAGRTAEDLIVGFAGSAEYYSEHSAKS